jgi:hypothetical protein
VARTAQDGSRPSRSEVTIRGTRQTGPSGGTLLQIALVIAASGIAAAQQLPLSAPSPSPLPPWVAVKPIEPPARALPSEEASADVTRFSFLGYGDTRSGTPQPGVSGDGVVVHPEHTRIIDRMIVTAGELKSSPFPVRFVLQSGDAVLRGQNAEMWNVSFTPIIERLTRGAGIPYFFSAGNHDVGTMPPGDPRRALGLHNTLTAMSKVIPAEGSPRRLSGYLTYAFGYGNAFVIAIDSNIASDAVQLSWVTDQLDRLDRTRYKHVIVFFHHPPYSSGPHGGGSADPVPGTGRKAPDRVELQSAAIRTLYMPLFRRHHVRLLVTVSDSGS